MTTVQTYRIKFESLLICQFKLWNIWIDPKVISRLTKYYYKKSNFSYNSNSILDQSSSDQRACGIYGRLVVSILQEHRRQGEG